MTLSRALGDWRGKTGPLYRQLAQAIRGLIRQGALEPGEQLPSERAAAQTLSLSRRTIVAAYEQLKVEGWVEARRGSGTRVARPDALWQPESGGSRTLSVTPRRPGSRIDLSSGGMPALDMVGEELRALIDREVPALLSRSGYATSGLWQLRETIAAHLGDQGLETTPEQVLITNGAQQAFALIVALYLRPSQTVALEDPTNPPAIDVCRMSRADMIPVPVDAQGIATDELEARLGVRPPRLLYVTPCFSNPTGTSLPIERRRALAEFAARYRTIVVEDTAHTLGGLAEAPPRPYVSQFDESGRVILIGTLSKLFWAGLRIGWVRAREPQIAELLRYKVAADLGSPILEQALAARLLPRASEAAGVLRSRLNPLLDATLATIRRQVPEWTVHRPGGGASMWVELPERTANGRRSDAAAFAALADSEGVSVAPGSLFSVNQEHRRFLAIAYLQRREVLHAGVTQLIRSWRRYTGGA